MKSIMIFLISKLKEVQCSHFTFTEYVRTSITEKYGEMEYGDFQDLSSLFSDCFCDGR